jgi:hypothetical protein
MVEDWLSPATSILNDKPVFKRLPFSGTLDDIWMDDDRADELSDLLELFDKFTLA